MTNMVSTTIHTENNQTIMIYHSTKVCVWNRDNNMVTLNTGGFFTPTTKKRMNQFSKILGLFFSVHQRQGQWVVVTPQKNEKDSFLTFFENNQTQFEVLKNV